MSQTDSDRLTEAFGKLTGPERQLLTCALAGNHPAKLAHLRMPVLRALAKADRPRPLAFQSPRWPR